MPSTHHARVRAGCCWQGDWKERFFVLYYTEEWNEYHLIYYKDEANFEVRLRMPTPPSISVLNLSFSAFSLRFAMPHVAVLLLSF